MPRQKNKKEKNLDCSLVAKKIVNPFKVLELFAHIENKTSTSAERNKTILTVPKNWIEDVNFRFSLLRFLANQTEPRLRFQTKSFLIGFREIAGREDRRGISKHSFTRIETLSRFPHSHLSRKRFPNYVFSSGFSATKLKPPGLSLFFSSNQKGQDRFTSMNKSFEEQKQAN